MDLDIGKRNRQGDWGTSLARVFAPRAERLAATNRRRVLEHERHVFGEAIGPRFVVFRRQASGDFVQVFPNGFPVAVGEFCRRCRRATDCEGKAGYRE